MPGFAAGEQQDLADLVLGCRGSLPKVAPRLADSTYRIQLVALRLAVLFHHARRPIDLPRIGLTVRPRIDVRMAARWLKAHPLTAYLLERERSEWAAAGYPWRKGR